MAGISLNNLISGFVLVLVLIFHPGCGDKSIYYPTEEWQTATPEEVGIVSAGLEDAIDYLRIHSGWDGVEELVIIRKGYLIYQGDSAEKVHGVWSMTKSFASTVLGILIDDGKCSLHTQAYEYVPVLAEDYADVTLRHFATMTSGYRAIGDEASGDYRHGPSSTPFIPNPVPLFNPGKKFAYWDSAMNQFANVLTQIAGRPLEEIFRDRIAQKIGMDENDWEWGDFGKYDGIRVNSGAGNHTRLNISALSMARFGYLFLRNGKWENDQLISTSWISEATRVQVKPHIPLAGYIDHGPGTYGYNWWVNGAGPSGKKKWPDAPSSTYAASGYNNNDMFVIPEWDLVIVRLGLDQSSQLITDEIYNRFLHLVGQSIAD